MVAVQMAGVVEVKKTGSVEEAVAVKVGVAAPNGLSGRGAKEMVWLPGVTWKLWDAGSAGDQLALPDCDAWMVHVPTDSNAEVEQTAGVVDANDTVSPDVDVALSVGIELPNAVFGSGPKEIV